MTINYIRIFLSDGSGINITKELYEQLMFLEPQKCSIEDEHLDFLKKQYNKELRNERNYYIHNVSLESKLEEDNANEIIIRDNRLSIEDEVIKNERLKLGFKSLENCTPTQRRRFIKHYYFQYSYSEIAIQENCTKRAVACSIKKVERMLINYEQY